MFEMDSKNKAQLKGYQKGGFADEKSADELLNSPFPHSGTYSFPRVVILQVNSNQSISMFSCTFISDEMNLEKVKKLGHRYEARFKLYD